jgi:uncharacterized SAM-binding protein YcdF (DUF218 family)
VTYSLLSQLLLVFVYPLGLAVALGVVALLGFRRLRRVAMALSLVILWVASMPVSASFLLHAFEGQYPPIAIENLPHADVAIVLGGSIGQPFPPRVAPDLSDAVDRVIHAARLFRAGKVQYILVSGGNQLYQSKAPPESHLVADLLVELGVPRSAIVEDTESANTHENAVNSAAIMRSRGWSTALLITSAAHMPRAVATFTRVGVNLTPAATDVKFVYPMYGGLFDLLPEAGALASTTNAIKELIGLIVYRLRGWA